MSDLIRAQKKKSNPVPKVLLKAKKEAILSATGKEGWDKAWEKGPWDKGHWANRG